MVGVSRRKICLPTVGDVTTPAIEVRRLELPGVELGPAATALARLLLDRSEESTAQPLRSVARAHPHDVDRQPLPYINGVADAAAQQLAGVVYGVRRDRS